MELVLHSKRMTDGASQTQVISNSGHEDMIVSRKLRTNIIVTDGCWFLQHDAVLDYYGRRLATCSSDKTIKIFEVDGETHRLTDTLKGWELR